MKPVELISNTLFCRVQDGRIIFRPWGARGACYLLPESQRIQRSRIQLAYYIAMLAVIVMTDALDSLAIAALLFMLGNYLLYWLFARGLPTTEAPAKPDPEYARGRQKELSRNFGKPALWAFLLLAGAMALAGVFAGVMLGDPVPVLGGGFFGLCAFVFARRLRNF